MSDHLYTHSYNSASANSTKPMTPVNPNPTVGNHWLTRHTPTGPGAAPKGKSFMPRGLKITLAILTVLATFLVIPAEMSGGQHPAAWFGALLWVITLGGGVVLITDSLRVHPTEWKWVGKTAAVTAAFFYVKHLVHRHEEHQADILANAIVKAENGAQNNVGF